MCPFCGRLWDSISRALSRQERLSSKAKKRLQESNASIEKLGAKVDKERVKLGQAMSGFIAGGSFETTLHCLTDDLNEAEEASVESHSQILAYSKRLERLEKEVRQ